MKDAHDNKSTACQFCPDLFDDLSKLKEHEEEHMRVGDISVKAMVQSVKNEYKKVIAESQKCKACDQYKMIMCEHHTKLVKMLREALHE